MITKGEYEDIPIASRKKEKILANKIVKILLPVHELPHALEEIRFHPDFDLIPRNFKSDVKYAENLTRD